MVSRNNNIYLFYDFDTNWKNRQKNRVFFAAGPDRISIKNPASRTGPDRIPDSGSYFKARRVHTFKFHREIVPYRGTLCPGTLNLSLNPGLVKISIKIGPDQKRPDTGPDFRSVLS